jgi:tRNA (Thr-GGU) A37 N-methylase
MSETSEEDHKTCPECGQRESETDVYTLDGAPICARCLFGDAPVYRIHAIGTVRNDRKRRQRGFGITGNDRSEIHLYEPMTRFMSGLAEEKRLTIVWLLHQQRGLKTTFARGIDGKTVGPFASRTPDRPTPIAVTDVELEEVRGNILIVKGLDAIDGTPVLDIKMRK